MSDPSPADEEGHQGKAIELSLNGLEPEDALQGFMGVDPEKVKNRLESESGDVEDDG